MIVNAMEEIPNEESIMKVCYTIKDATVVTVKAMKRAMDSCWRKCF